MRFKLGEQIKGLSPRKCYELELSFEFKDRDDRLKSIYFPVGDKKGLSMAVDLIKKYEDVDYNSRCCSTFEDVVDSRDLDQELLATKDGGPFHDFLHIILNEWPVNECGLPYMLGDWRIRFYDSFSRIYKVQVINDED